MNKWQFSYTNSPCRVRYLTSSAFIFASGKTSFGCRLAFKRSGGTGVTPPVDRRSSHMRNAGESSGGALSGGALEPIRKLLESYESDVIAFQALDTVFGGAPIDTTIAHVPGAAGLPLGKPRRCLR